MNKKVAVIIPSYKVKNFILDVINRIGSEVQLIYVIDDKCPEESGKYVEEICIDPRVRVIYNEVNLGVGGAVMNGYKAALEDDCDIMVKIDGDGQMDPQLINRFISPIIEGEADYTKGNRFYDIELVKDMPAIRLFGNSILSFMNKFSSGYYEIFDPTNGYTAISSTAANLLPFGKIASRYFFESDMLFRLNLIGAKVIDIPMKAIYGDETSNLHISKILFPFLKGYVSNFHKRIFYNYFLRDFSIASIELVLGTMMLIFGLIYGIYSWGIASSNDTFASSGTVMLSAMPIIIGIQFLLSFVNYDISIKPKKSLTYLFNNITKDKNVQK